MVQRRKADPGRGDTLFTKGLWLKGAEYRFVSTKDCCGQALRHQRTQCRKEVGSTMGNVMV